jgi:hypothetical protein
MLVYFAGDCRNELFPVDNSLPQQFSPQNLGQSECSRADGLFVYVHRFVLYWPDVSALAGEPVQVFDLGYGARSAGIANTRARKMRVKPA